MLSPAELSDVEGDLLPNDANDIERIIRDRENDSDGGGGFASDEAEEDTATKDEGDVNDSEKRRIDPNAAPKRVRNPQPVLNAARLNGPKGVQAIEKYFEGFKFHGKGYERSDLNQIMKRLEHWSHRLFPKYEFDDCLEKIEKLGTKKEVQTHVKKIRLGMIEADEGTTRNDDGDPEDEKMEDSAPFDEFDALITEQIEKQKQFATPQRPNTSAANTPSNANTTLKTTPNPSKPHTELTAEMKEKIERNRQMAIQKRLARIQAMEEEAKRKVAQEEQNASHQLEIANAQEENASNELEIAGAKEEQNALNQLKSSDAQEEQNLSNQLEIADTKEQNASNQLEIADAQEEQNASNQMDIADVSSVQAEIDEETTPDDVDLDLEATLDAVISEKYRLHKH